MGKPEAEQAFVEKYREPVLYFLFRRCGNRATAEDICHEALMIVLHRLREDSLAETAKLAAFIQQTAANLWINEQRKLSRRKTDTNEDAIARASHSTTEQFDVIATAELQQNVRKLIDEMPTDRDRRLLYRLYVEEADKHEICEELGLSARHFDRVVHRARQRFKAIAGDLSLV